MINISDGGTAKVTPGETIPPNGSASFIMGYNETTVIVANPSEAGVDGAIIYVWLYADVNSVTPVSQPITSGDNFTLNPVPDSNGNRAAVLVVMNTGQATLTASRR